MEPQDVGTCLRTGKVWSPSAEAWVQVEACREGQLRCIRDAIEALYESGSGGVPGGEAGARMILWHLSQRLSIETGNNRSFQIRAKSVFASSVEVPWNDTAGRRVYKHRIEAKKIPAYAEMIASQVQRWSEFLWDISKGRIALYHRTEPIQGQLTRFKKMNGQFSLNPRCIKHLIGCEFPAENVNVLIFWAPTDGPDSPPLDSHAYLHGRKLPDAPEARVIFVHSSLRWLHECGQRTEVVCKLRQEFWHFMQSRVKKVCFKGLMPSPHGEKVEMMSQEMQWLGLPKDHSKYDYMYSACILWRTCAKLREKYRWIDDWGRCPRALDTARPGDE